tara:strand:+ start:1535 stop:2317 length:783 start_codon:yes stop_codon:yes gene_type:complete
MSNVGNKLDLSGINVTKAIRQPRVGLNRQKFAIQLEEEAATSSSCISTKVVFGTIFIAIVSLFLWSFSSTTSTATQIVSPSMKKLTPSLRKIIRMTCAHDTTTHCTTQNEGGEYVVNVKDCPVYDFNNIPFTELERDINGNFHVPPSADLTLTVTPSCEKTSATYDTKIKYNNEYAEKSNSVGPIYKVVWIPVKPCYNDFTLIIDKQEILQNTPATMIEQETLNGIKAYIYEVDGSVSGSISVTGTGCKVPIRIYSRRLL